MERADFDEGFSIVAFLLQLSLSCLQTFDAPIIDVTLLERTALLVGLSKWFRVVDGDAYWRRITFLSNNLCLRKARLIL